MINERLQVALDMTETIAKNYKPKTIRWQTLKADLLNFGNYIRWRDKKCMKCLTTDKLEGHHIYNKYHYPELALDTNNGICLCSSCHGDYHRIYGKDHNNPLQLKEFLQLKYE